MHIIQGETEDEYLTSCLLMVFVAVSIPKLAKSESSMYQAQLEVITENNHLIQFKEYYYFPRLNFMITIKRDSRTFS